MTWGPHADTSEFTLACWLAPAQGSRRRLLVAWAMLGAWIAVLVVLYLLTTSPSPQPLPLRGYGLLG